MSSTHKSRKQASQSNYDDDDPEYDELVEYLEKSAALITHYSNENYDLKQEIDVHKKIKNVMQNDYSELQKKVVLLEKNNNKVRENGNKFKNFLQSIGNTTTEEYKTNSRKRFDKLAQEEIDRWNKIKNSN